MLLAMALSKARTTRMGKSHTNLQETITFSSSSKFLLWCTADGCYKNGTSQGYDEAR